MLTMKLCQDLEQRNLLIYDRLRSSVSLKDIKAAACPAAAFLNRGGDAGI